MTPMDAAREIAPAVVSADAVGLRVGGLELRLDARNTGLRLAVPPTHVRFLQPQTTEGGDPQVGCGCLSIRIRGEPPPEARHELAPLYLSENWELWLDKAGRYVFVAPRLSPPQWIVVDPDFASGEVLGDFSSNNGRPFYPIARGLEILVFVNWLANLGDVILHAAGVVVGGRGYCFAGSSGVGKSTLAAALSRDPGVTVFSEDQVVLRYLEGRFWVYGAPWHENPAMCSPLGVPLDRIFFLERTGPDGVAACAALDGVTRLLQTAFVPYYRPAAVAAILDRLALLAEQAPFYTLRYRIGSDVWESIRAA